MKIVGNKKIYLKPFVFETKKLLKKIKFFKIKLISDQTKSRADDVAVIGEQMEKQTMDGKKNIDVKVDKSHSVSKKQKI